MAETLRNAIRNEQGQLFCPTHTDARCYARGDEMVFCSVCNEMLMEPAAKPPHVGRAWTGAMAPLPSEDGL